MTDEANFYQSEDDQQLAAQLYMIMKAAHEAGLLAQRRLEDMNSLAPADRLFLSRKERRGMPG